MTVEGKETEMEPMTTTKIRELVMRERDMAVSEREWQHRLRGYGYGLRETDEGRIVTSLVRGGDLFTLGGATV